MCESETVALFNFAKFCLFSVASILFILPSIDLNS